MWEEPEKDKGRDTAGQEGGGEVDRERGREQRGNEGDILGRIGERNGCSENNGAKGGRESWL